MTATDELRAWAHGPDEGDDWLDRIDEFCDRIDAEAEDNERFRREAGPFCDRLREAAAECADVTLFGVDYIALPVDADGEYIHFGDVLDQFGTPMTVFAMSDPDPDQGDCMLELITDGISDGTWVRARKMRHHHAPTVEDVLREFAEKIIDSQIPSMHPTYEEAIAEYAKRLRLAEEADA